MLCFVSLYELEDMLLHHFLRMLTINIVPLYQLAYIKMHLDIELGLLSNRKAVTRQQ